MVLVRTGARPFWFELAAGGPRLIASPQHASLEPFIPWKLARYIAGFLAGENALTAAVNQEGFMVFERGEKGEIAVYYYRNPAWAMYSAAPPFYNSAGLPAVLLTRDTTFIERELEPPNPAFWALDEGMMVPFEPAVFAGFEAASGWETESLLWDGALWYCRLIRRNGASNEVFLKTADLNGTAETASSDVFLAAAQPRAAASAPELLARTMETAGNLAGKPCTFKAVSPEWDAARIFGKGLDDNITELVEASAYYRNGAALTLLSDGRGVFETSGEQGRFALPPLPENYVYTQAVLAPGNGSLTLIAAWEEQKDWNVGAAGFMLLDIRR
jgi:hypothetical protein